MSELLRFATAGSVDDGKSTLIGRLLFDTKTILAEGGYGALAAFVTAIPRNRETGGRLKEALAKTSHPEAELKRVVSYLRFQKGFAQWQSLRESSDVVRRQQLASALSQQLPERLRQGEVSMGEAMMLAAALWSDLEPNEDKRKVRLEEVRAVLAQSVPQPDAAQLKRLRDEATKKAAVALKLEELPSRLSPADLIAAHRGQASRIVDQTGFDR